MKQQLPPRVVQPDPGVDVVVLFDVDAEVFPGFHGEEVVVALAYAQGALVKGAQGGWAGGRGVGGPGEGQGEEEGQEGRSGEVTARGRWQGVRRGGRRRAGVGLWPGR